MLANDSRRDCDEPLAGPAHRPAERISSATAWPPTCDGAVRAALDRIRASSARRWSTSRCRTPSCRFPCTTSSRRPKPRSNLSRFDGVRYGHRAAEYSDLLDMYKKSRAEGFGPEVQAPHHGRHLRAVARLLRRLLPAGAEDPPHDRATTSRQRFKQCDVIVGPVAPTVAWNLGAKADDPVQIYLADIFTLPASLAGLPGMSVPAASARQNGMPVGLQLIGNYFGEAPAAARRPRVPAGDRLAHARAWQASHDRAPWSVCNGKSSSVLRRTLNCRPQSKIFQRRRPRLRRRAEHASQRRSTWRCRARCRCMNRGAVERAIRFGLAVGAKIAPQVDLRAQELLLSRPAEGLPDQPVRDPGGAGRHGRRFGSVRTASQKTDVST